MLIALNFFAVFLYGLLIMAFMLGIRMNRKNVIVLSVFVILSGLLQHVLYSAFGGEFIRKAYPLVVHLPLMIVFCIYFQKRLASVLFVLCTAYVLTAPRKWFGDLIAAFFQNDPSVSIVFQIIVSVFMLVAVYRYLCPYVVKILEYSGAQLRLLTVVPALYYLIAYATTVYTQLLYHSNMVVIGLLTTGLSFVFYSFLVLYFSEMTKRLAIKNEQAIMKIQTEAIVLQLEHFKEAEKKTAIYRHDLRHYLQLINGFLVEGNISDAQKCIIDIGKNISETATVNYCSNNAVNLILSSYINMANCQQIQTKSAVCIPENCKVTDADLCIILANAIENAIHACKAFTDPQKKVIRISCRTKNNRLLIEVINPYMGEVRFTDDLPQSAEKGHGIGSLSIAALTEKYHGVYSFKAVDGIFTMQVIL